MAKRTQVTFKTNKRISFIGKSPGKRMQRQGMTVTPNELRNLANKLQSEFEDRLNNLDIKLRDDDINNRKFLVNIINKTSESDTWEFE